MTKPKLTPWFPGHTKPARVGVYERKYVTGNLYSLWDGRWCFGETTADGAAAIPLRSPFQKYLWRGLAQAPKGQQ